MVWKWDDREIGKERIGERGKGSVPNVTATFRPTLAGRGPFFGRFVRPTWQPMTAQAILLSLAFFSLTGRICVAQTEPAPMSPPSDIKERHPHIDVPQTEQAVPDEPVMHAEVSPIFPGGDLGLAKELKRHLKYPKEALEIGLQGKVFVQYVVAVDGSIGDIKVVRGVHPLLDKAAVDAVKHLPKYSEPAKMNGKPVPFQMVLPVVFQAQ